MCVWQNLMLIYQDLSDAQKKFIRRLFSAAFLFVTVFFAAYAVYYAALAVDTWRDMKRTDAFQIAVSGEGSVFAVPDIAALSIGVRSQSKLLKDAQSDNTEKYNAVVAFLKSNGVEEKDIKTSYYNVNPQYQYDNRPCPLGFLPCPPRDPPVIAGYEITSTLQVKVRNLDSVGTILDGAVSSGANEVHGPSFTIDDKTTYKDEAKKIAVENARASAKKLFKNLGVRIVRVAGFSESGGYPPIYYPRTMEAFGKGGDMAAPGPSIEPGENEVRVMVNVIYEVR